MRGRFEFQTLEKATAEPEKTQRSFLLDLIKENAGSEFGRKHNFEAIRSISQFRQRVPIRDYEGYRPFINRIIRGDRSVLTRQDPFMLTLTSGTTDEPKYIPVTKRSQSLNSSLMRQWLCRAEQSHKGLLDHASGAIVSRAVEGATPFGLPFGSASGVIYKNIPWFIRRAYAVPYAVSEIEDYDLRYFALARFTLGASVSLIATANATTLLRLARTCGENQERLIRAIHDGILGIDLGDQKKLHAELSSRLRPDRERARQLFKIVNKKGCLRLAECWPDLKMIGCWLGGSVGIQAAKLFEHFGDVPMRDLGYMASEGNFTMPVADGTSSGILAIKNNFYEFIPEAEIEAPAPNILSSHELETGKRYGILLTTAAGLYRYQINDIVEVTGTFRRTPLIAFVRKAGEMANITGEKIHVNHLLLAVAATSTKFSLKVEQFRAVPDLEDCRYEIYLELKQRVFSEKLQRELLHSLDHELQYANIEYQQKRKSGRLKMPVIYLMKRGWAEAGLRRHIAEGKRDTQYKPQIICAERSDWFLKFILEEIKEKDSVCAPDRSFVRRETKAVRQKRLAFSGR